MISLLRRAPAGNPAVDPLLFREAMNRPAVARELFLPMELAWWDGSRFTLGRWGRSAPRPSLRGVRLQEPRPSASGPPPERDTQADLAAVVGSVAELRRIPELAALVLSDETLVGRQAGAIPGKRVLFGLRCSPNGRFQAEVPAAAECHRVMQKAVKSAGFAVEFPKQPFDALSGFAGLRDWAANVRLRRKRSGRVLLVLLFLLPFLLYFAWSDWPSSPSAASPGAAAGADSLTKSLGAGSDAQKLLKELKEMGISSGDSASPLAGVASTAESVERSVASAKRLAEVGTVAYIVGAVWLLWVANDVGVGTVLGMLFLPFYGFVCARSNWSKTWLPLLVHTAGMVMIGLGIYYMLAPLFDVLKMGLG
jgi:hypothetical protein